MPPRRGCTAGRPRDAGLRAVRTRPWSWLGRRRSAFWLARRVRRVSPCRPNAQLAHHHPAERAAPSQV